MRALYQFDKVIEFQKLQGSCFLRATTIHKFNFSSFRAKMLGMLNSMSKYYYQIPPDYIKVQNYKTEFDQHLSDFQTLQMFWKSEMFTLNYSWRKFSDEMFILYFLGIWGLSFCWQTLIQFDWLIFNSLTNCVYLLTSSRTH